MTALLDTKKPTAEAASLRGEVMTLQKSNRDLRKDFDDLKKKLDALSARPATPPKARKP